MYSGHVYNKNNGKPIPGLCVTDGRNIVRTDENGAFSLPEWEKAHVISVGALTCNHTDWFQRIDDNTETYDFYITPAQAEAGHSFLHISDTEVSFGCGPWLQFVKRCVQEEKTGFLIQTGDIRSREGLETHYKDMNYDTMGCPVRYTMGNHDYVDDQYGEYTFERLYGPVWYSFEYGNVHYVVLPMKSGDAPGCYAREDSDIWLKKDLEMADPAKKVIIFCHDICAPDEDGFRIPVQGETLDLKAHNLLAWCFGHFHIHFCNDLGGVYNICTSRPYAGGIDSSPAGVRKTTIHDDGTLSSVLLYNDIKQAEEGDPGVWRTQLGNRVLYGKPIYADGKIFVATFENGFPKNTAIYGLDASTGEICWKYDTVNGVKSDMALADGKIYAQDSFGWVYCLRTEDGAVCWQKYVNMDGYPHHSNTNVLVTEGMVITGCVRKVIALDAVSGEEVWSSKRIPKLEEGPCRLIRFRQSIIVGAQWYGVYALDLKTGETLWTNHGIRYRTTTPGIWGNMLYLTTTDKLACMEGDTGTIIYNYSLGREMNFNTSSSPVRDGDNLYLCSATNGVVRYNGITLEKNAEYPCGHSIVSNSPYMYTGTRQVQGTPLLENGNLIYAAADGYLYICRADTAELVQKFHIGAPCFNSPVRVGDYLITADFNGRVTAYAWPVSAEN